MFKLYGTKEKLLIKTDEENLQGQGIIMLTKDLIFFTRMEDGTNNGFSLP